MAKFVSGKWQGYKPTQTPGDINKAQDDYINMLYSQGQGKTDIGGKLTGAYDQVTGGDWLGGLASGVAGIADYMGSSGGRNILAGASKDPDYQAALLQQAQEQKAQEEKMQEAYGAELSDEKKLQTQMEIARIQAAGQAAKGTDKPLDLETAVNILAKTGVKGTALIEGAQKIVDEQNAKNLAFGKKGWSINPLRAFQGTEDVVVPPTYKDSGSASRLATPKKKKKEVYGSNILKVRPGL